MIRINKGNLLKFRVWDEDKKVMHQADEVSRIHFQDGSPYCVTLWDGEMLLNFILYLDYTLEK